MSRYLLLIPLLLFATAADAGGFRESRAWNFEGPVSIAAKIAAEQLRLQKKGGWYDETPGSKAWINQTYHSYQTHIQAEIDKFGIAAVGSIAMSSNIQNASTVAIENDDGWVNVDVDQDGGEQSASNIINGDVEAESEIDIEIEID